MRAILHKKTFEELTTDELYELLRVRSETFVVGPVLVERVATLDTASVLENKYAKSEAVVSGGVLHHSLQTKPVRSEEHTSELQSLY